MPRFRVVDLALLLLPALALPACGTGPSFVVRHEPWRAEEERACLASGLVRETPFVTARSALGGPLDGSLGGAGACGALKPFKMAAAVDGSVAFEPSALVRCPMVHAIEYWTNHVVKPAARRHLGADVVAVKVASSYACRPMNHVSGAFLSEHGHANALERRGLRPGRRPHRQGQELVERLAGRARFPARSAAWVLLHLHDRPRPRLRRAPPRPLPSRPGAPPGWCADLQVGSHNTGDKPTRPPRRTRAAAPPGPARDGPRRWR